MKDSIPIKDVITAAGGLGPIAVALGISKQAVCAWALRGVPANRVIAVEALTGIPRTAIRPDIYPEDT